MRLLLCISIWLSISIAQASDHGLMQVQSAHSVEQTTKTLQNILKKKKFNIFAVVDHQKNAQKAGLDLPKSTLIIFGNPKVGTPLMKAKATIGIDLPVKLHIFENNKKVLVSYNDPIYLAKRHGLDVATPQIQKMAGALKKIVGAATKKNY